MREMRSHSRDEKSKQYDCALTYLPISAKKRVRYTDFKLRTTLECIEYPY